MEKQKLSLRQAILVPFAVIVLIVVCTFAILWNYNYDRLAEKQGEDFTQIMSTMIDSKIKTLMQEPCMLVELSAVHIAREKLFEQEDLRAIQEYELSVYNTLDFSLPQISTISYGDERGNYVGIRLNSDQSYSLMLKDKRTDNKLIIYDGTDISAEEISVFDEYDLKQRPWYVQGKASTQQEWSDIYTNYDEKKRLTISTLTGIYDEAGNFTGTMCYDVSLDGLNDYLKSQFPGNGITIYIVDRDWKLIAQSAEDIGETGADAEGTDLISAADSPLPAIRESSAYFKELGTLPDHIVRKEIDGKISFMHACHVEELESLGWKIVILIPETELMGNMKSNQISLIIVGLLITVIGSAAGILLINSVIGPITRSIKGASEIAEGKYGIHIQSKKTIIKESWELISAFNKMSDKLREYIDKIRRNEEEYRTLVENISNAIFSISPDGNILSVNNVFEEVIGRDRADIIGKNFSILFKDKERVDYFEKLFLYITKEKEHATVPHYFLDKDGNQKVHIADFIPLLNDDGEVLQILGSTTDITELDKAQKEIKYLHEKEKERLQELVEEKTAELNKAIQEIVEMEKFASLGSLVSGVAHEINTPLGVAVSAASYMEETNKRGQNLLLAGEMTKGEFIKYIESMNETSFILNNNLKKAAELVKNFKQMAVNQSNEQKENFNFNEFLNNLLISLKHEYKNTGIQFVIECDEALSLNSYPGAYSQVFTNLIMNSIIHAFPDKEGIIKIAVAADEKDIIIQYSDDGQGIKRANLNKIFTPFFTTNRKGGGSGLGLSIVYNIVTAQLGGKITCESTRNKGTIFNIRVPVILEEKTYDKGMGQY